MSHSLPHRPGMTPALPDEAVQYIGAAILAGNKIEAIKRYRKVTSASLAESKLAVEEMEARMRADTPEAFAAGDAIKTRSQKRFFPFYCLAALYMAIRGVDATMRMARGETISWVTVSLAWIATLCFIGAALSIGRSLWGSPRRR